MKQYSLYAFRGSFSAELPRIDVFHLFADLLRSFSALDEAYWVTGLAKKIPFHNIVEFIERGPSTNDPADQIVGFYRLDKRGILKEQSVTYFPNLRLFTVLIGRNELSSPDDLVRALGERFRFSNVLCSLMSYSLSFHDKWFKPPNSNLFEGPGLSNDRNGYIEGVSAEMWFGETFWQHAKCAKADILKQDWLHCEERPTHLYVRAWPKPFSSAEGEQGEIQRRLLDLLFGINERTPPPLPPPSQNSFVQKVLVDGNHVRDLGMDEVRPDGGRVPISPPEPPHAS
jgi:hypothetical protein